MVQATRPRTRLAREKARKDAAVLHQLEHGEPKQRRAIELMAAYLGGALVGLEELGLRTRRRRQRPV